MKLNVARAAPKRFTHEGAVAANIFPLQELRRTVMACMLWEDSFYEDGQSVADRIKNLVPRCKAEDVMAMAITARTDMKLRHVPLLLVREMARHASHRWLVADTLYGIIQRPDELTEFLAIYWKDGKCPLSAQVKKGLARAFAKFNEYQLAKYDRDGAVKLRDVMFLTHPKPTPDGDRYTKDERKSERDTGKKFELSERELMYQRVVTRTLQTPDTWETQLSGGADKRETFLRLMNEKKLGALAFLRNLRNMSEASITDVQVRQYAESLNVERVLPFRFLSAARAVPQWEPIIEPLMLDCMQAQEKFEGPTAILIDHSGSMSGKVSAKSEISRFDAACAVAILLREVCDDLRVFTFSDFCIEVPPRRGFALRDAIQKVSHPRGTLLGKAVTHVYNAMPGCRRLIVITDEQSHDKPKAPNGHGYVVNVASYQNGVGYGAWTHIDGWSEAVIDFIREYEKAA